MRRAAATAVLLVALGSGPATAAVPPGFVGVVAGPELLDRPALVPSELLEMRRTGIRSIRVPLNWSQLEPAPGRYAWTGADRIVGGAARDGIGVLPAVLAAPVWAAADPTRLSSAPRRPEDYARFMAVLARRYGPRGAFWHAHPALRARPIRTWQIWNEPSVPYFWDLRPWPERYAALLRAARRALRVVDPGARAMLAGSPRDSWRALERLYRAGAGRTADVVAVHPFTRRPGDVLRVVELNRAVMRRWGDRTTPIAVTETSYPSARGRTSLRYGFEVTEARQAALVPGLLARYSAARRRLRISAVYWYTWLSTDRDPVDPFAYAGLRTLRDGAPRAKPAWRAFRAALARLEGRPGSR